MGLFSVIDGGRKLWSRREKAFRTSCGKLEVHLSHRLRNLLAGDVRVMLRLAYRAPLSWRASFQT